MERVGHMRNRLEKFQTQGPLGGDLIVLPLKRSKDGLPKFVPDALHGWKPRLESSSGQNPGLWAHPAASSYAAPPSWAAAPTACLCGVCVQGLWAGSLGEDGSRRALPGGEQAEAERTSRHTLSHTETCQHARMHAHAHVHLHTCACVHVCAHVMTHALHQSLGHKCRTHSRRPGPGSPLSSSLRPRGEPGSAPGAMP